MTPSQWSQLKALFDQALEKPHEARDEFLNHACGASAELRAELKRLLAEYDRDSGVLSQVAGHAPLMGRPESPPRFAPGAVLARRFRIVRFLSRGGMGEVYEAEDTELGEHVALKAIRPEIAGDERVLGWFKREIQLARRVTHPHVCRMYDLVQHEHGPASTCLLSMELIPGQTLAHYLKAHGPMSPQAALPVIEQMASALQAAHEAGVIHRDFKPGNVMLAAGADRPRAVVMDFGLAFPALHPDVDSDTAARGTLSYMAPEQRQGGPATAASDVYALGLVIREMIGAGQDCPPGVWKDVLPRCLAHDPANRYQRPADVAAALRGALHSPWHGLTRRAAGVLAALALVGTVVGVSWYSRSHTPPLPGNWVLVARFENHTGEPLLDGALQAALERELRQTGFIHLAARERVEDTLRLMKKPPGTPLDASLAREVCLRDGGIQILVTGSARKQNTRYLLSAQLIDPVTNRTLATAVEEAPDAAHIWPTVRTLSNWVRESLGEEMEQIEHSNQRLEKATTPSLRAVELFTRAAAAERRSAWAEVVQWNRQAIAEDPNFALAHISLARALKASSGGDWQYEAHRALDLAPSASERERYFIEGSSHVLNGEYQAAVAPLETLTRLYPDDYLAATLLARTYRALGRAGEAGNALARAADLRPNDYRTNASVAVDLRPVDFSRAVQYARRAILLAPRDGGPATFTDATYVFPLPFFDVWQTDARGALTEVDTLAGTFANPPDLMLDWRIGELYLALGQVHAARAWFARTLPPEPRVAADVYALYVAGDEAGARARVAALRAENPISDVWFLVARLRPDADRFLAPVVQRLGQQENGPRQMPGEVALSQGRVADAIQILGSTFNNFHDLRTGQMVAESLVKALEISGDRETALAVLEEAGRRDKIMTPVFWLRNQAHLSAYYHALGREIEARKIDDQLRQRLAVADPDFPILKQLNR